MDLPGYFEDVATELDRRSAAIRRDFATHHHSGGSNRETLVGDFLRTCLPKEFGVDTGLVTSSDGQFSKQADLVVVDHSWNAPFYPSAPNRIWLVEAVYVLIEVKTSLSPSDLGDSVAKCRRFKSLPRRFSDAPTSPRLTDSLFVIWSYESPSAETLKANLADLITVVPIAEQPDFVIVPGRLVATSGHYREISTLGQPGSAHRQSLQEQYGPQLDKFVFDPIQVDECGKHSLLVWVTWLLSWLKRAGPRNSELLGYLPPDRKWGRRL